MGSTISKSVIHQPGTGVQVLTSCAGIRSSRTIARLLESDDPIRFLAINRQSDFRAISKFRQDNREVFTYL